MAEGPGIAARDASSMQTEAASDGGKGPAETVGAHDIEPDGSTLDAVDGSRPSVGVVPDGSIRTIDAPPKYLGSLNNSAACATEYSTAGFEPQSADGMTLHPLFIYFVGTTFTPGAAGSSYDGKAPIAVTAAMARRGFVALSAQYDNGPIAWLSDHQNQLACLFGPENSKSLLAVACAMPGVDCDLGIAMWGHSQGALVAHLAANTEERVRAVWATGYGGDTRAKLAKERLRVVNGESDASNGSVAGLNATTGMPSAECPDDGRKECLRSNGSGWIIVARADCQNCTADHCWFNKTSCSANAEILEPNWVSPTSTQAFALDASADWVASMTRP